MHNLRIFIEGTRGKEVADKLFDDMSWQIYSGEKFKYLAIVIVRTKINEGFCLSFQGVISSDRHCFEAYG